jgi:hypothetical protein
VLKMGIARGLAGLTSAIAKPLTGLLGSVSDLVGWILERV